MDIDLSEANFPWQRREGRVFTVIEMRGIAQWDGLRMRWTLVVHKSGTFPAGVKVSDYENNPEYFSKDCELKGVLRYGELQNEGR